VKPEPNQILNPFTSGRTTRKKGLGYGIKGLDEYDPLRGYGDYKLRFDEYLKITRVLGWRGSLGGG